MLPWIHVAGLDLPSYFVCLAVGCLLAVVIAAWLGRRIGLPPVRVVAVGLVACAAGLVGARLWSVLADGQLAYYLKEPAEIPRFWRGGLTVNGGLVLGFAAAWAGSAMARMRLSDLLDVSAPAIAAGTMVGRLGCLLAGCCYGRPTLFPFALVFHDFDAVARPIGVPLHATQIYLATEQALLLGIALHLVLRRARRRGDAILGYLLLNGLLRFPVEWLRADTRGTLFGGALYTTQIECLVLAAMATFFLVLRLAGRTKQRVPPRLRPARRSGRRRWPAA